MDREKDRRKGSNKMSPRPDRNIINLLDKTSRQRGKNTEERVRPALEGLVKETKILSFRKASRKEDGMGKDYVFVFLSRDGKKITGWFDVKSSHKGIIEHEKKHKGKRKDSTPEIKRTRPAILIRPTDDAELIKEKILKVKVHFEEIYEEEYL